MRNEEPTPDTYRFSYEMLRTLRGAPLSCLLALALVGQPMGAEWIGRVTGYSDKPVAQALLMLEERRLISRTSRFYWQIVTGAFQLPIMQEAQALESGSRNISDSRPTTASTYIEESRGVRRAEAVKAEKESENFRVNLQALNAAQIYGAKARLLAGLEWVNPEYIAAHVAKVVEQEKTLGLAIRRMEDGDPKPKSQKEEEKEKERAYYLRTFGYDPFDHEDEGEDTEEGEEDE